MKANLANATRVFLGWAALATLPLSTPLYGAEAGFPFSENFQSPSLLNSTDTTARWTSNGVTLGRAQGRHMADLDLNLRNFRIGNSTATIGIKDIAARDMDGDGHLDVLIASDDGIFVYYIDEDDDLESIQPVRITSAGPIRTMVLGDFDRDGDLDVVVAGDVSAVIFYRNGGSRSAFDNHIRVSSLRTIALAPADMDGDGDLDLVLAQRKGKVVQVHLNDGVGNFSLHGNAFPTTSGQNRALGVGDFDNDEDMDIVLAKAGGVNVFYLNNGSGGFDEGRLLSHPGTAVDYRDIAVGDVNNNGHLDIVVGVHKVQNILYLNDGNGGFGTGSRINNSGARTIGVELVDMDGDGDLDLVEGVSRRGHRIYVNQNGSLDSVGAFIDGKTNAIAAGDVYMDRNLELIHGKTLATLKVSRLTKRRPGDLSTSRFDTGHGQVVSDKVNGGEQVPRVVYLTATAVQQAHTDIEYYLSNNGGKRWVRAYPGGNVWFPSEGDDLRWRAELKSRSPVQTTTLTRVGIEDVLQVSIDSDVFRDGGLFTATSHTIGTRFEPVTIRLMNPGNRALVITRVETVGEVFVLQDEDSNSLSQPLSIEIEGGDEHNNLRLVFDPEERERIYNSTLTIAGSEGGDALPVIKVALRGQGVGAEIDVSRSSRLIEARVGTGRSRTVEITNEGEKPLIITSTMATNPLFKRIEPAALPTTLTADISKDFKFQFKPEARGDTATTIFFFSNAVNGVVTRTLTGKGLAPVISVQQPGTDTSVQEIDFGRVRVNRPTSLTRVIKSMGDLPLIITAVTVENARFELLEPVIEDASSMTVPVNSTLALVLQFNPQRRVTTEGRLIIHSDAFNITQLRVMLEGRGTGPEIDFPEDDKIIYSDVRVGQSVTGSVEIANMGDEPLIVSGVRSKADNPAPPGVFSWVPPSPGAASQTVAAGMTAMLTLSFRPMDVDDFEDTLMIDSDAVNMFERPLTVKGKGVASEMVIVIADTGEKPENISSSTLSYDFGDRPINTSTSRQVFISNGGDASLEVSIPEIASREPFQWERRLDTITVAPRESTSILTLAFKPGTRGPFSTTLTFFSNVFNDTRTDIVLTGRGTAPMIGVKVNNERVASGAVHHLGELRTFKTTTVSVSVHNHGGADLKIKESLELAGGYSPHDIPDIRRTLRPTSSIEVLIPLMVKETGLVTGNLVIESDDPATPIYTAELRSTGVAPVMVVQVGGTTRTSGATFDLRTRINREVTTDIVVWNQGSADLRVDDIGLVRGGDIVERVGHYHLPGGGMTIPKNSSHTWTLHFRPPNAAILHEGLIKIVSDNAGASTLTLNVRGVGTRPDLATSFRGCSRERGIHCHLDGIRAGVTTSVELIISNRGNELLTGTVTMIHSDSVYRVYSIDQTGDFIVAPRESTTRTISFSPSDANPTPPGHSNYQRVVRVKIRTNDPYKRHRTIDVRSGVVGPEMHVDIGEPVPVYTGSTETRKREHDFGEAMVGASKSIPATIRNLGTELLTVTASVSGSAYRLLNKDGSFAENRLITIGGGLDELLDLHFAPPTVSSSHEGVLTIISNDYDESTHTVSLAGYSVPPGMKVFLDRDGNRRRYHRGDVYDLGDVIIDQPINTFIYLGNSATGSLNVSPLGVDGQGFSVENRLATLPERGVVESGVSAAYVGVLKFKSVGRGVHTGMLTIHSNDINGTEFTIRLRANVVSNDFEICMADHLYLWSISCYEDFNEEHDFGEVVVGSGPQIWDIEIDADEHTIHDIFNIYLENNESGQFDVVLPFTAFFYEADGILSFTPTETGVATAVLIVQLLDHSIASRVILRGTGVAPQMSVEMAGQTTGSDTGGYDFGMVPTGVEQPTTVTVSNTGDGNLKIESIGVVGAGYRLDGGDETRIIPAGSSANWTVHFTPPGDAASYLGVLKIVSNDKKSAPQGVWTMELNGSGVRNVGDFTTNPHDFGHVRVGTAGTIMFGGDVAEVTSGGDVFHVAPGHSTRTWKLSFSPTSATLYTGELETDDGMLSLRGTGAEPQMVVAIEPHDWSQVRLAMTEDVLVTVSNTGTVELDISSIGVTGAGYSLVNGDAPQTVAPGSMTTFSLRFVPTLPERLTGTLSIVSDDPRQPHWTTSVTGHGRGPRLVLRYKGRDISDGSVFSFRDESRREAFDLYNLGNEDLIIKSLRSKGWAPYAHLQEGSTTTRIYPPQVVSSNVVMMTRFYERLHFDRHMDGDILIGSNDPVHPVFRLRTEAKPTSAHLVDVYIGGRPVGHSMEYGFGSVPVGSEVTSVRVHNPSLQELIVNGATMIGSPWFSLSNLPTFPVALSGGASLTFDLSFMPTVTATVTAGLVLSTTGDSWRYRPLSYDFLYDGLVAKKHIITLRGNGIGAPAPSAWADGAQRPAMPTFAALESDISAPRFVGLGYADGQSRLWLAFDEPAQILSGTDARALADGAALSGFEVLPNYAGDSVEDIGVLRARYRSGGVVMDLARGVVSADALIWARYTPPPDGVSGIYDMASPPNRISSVRLFMLPRSAVLDYEGDGFPDALEARLGGNPLVADDVAGLPEVALLRAGVAGSPVAVAYSGIRADGVAAHLGLVTTGASSLAAYYLSDTFGYSGGYALGMDGYGCIGRFPSNYVSPLFGGGCAVVDFNNILAGVEHRIGWLAMNAAGYWAVAKGTASRLPEQVILRVPEFNMKRRNVFVGNSAAADATVVVGAFHDGPASSQSLTLSLSNVAAADSPSSSRPDGFSVSVSGVTTDPTSYAITGVHSGEASKLWLAGDPLSSLTSDKYSLGKVTQTSVVRLGDDNLPPLFGRALLYAGSTADENERHAVVVRGTESYTALLPVVHGSAQTASAFEVSPWDGAGGGGPVAANDRIVAVNTASPVADGAVVRIAFTASNPPATVRNTVSLEVAASSAGASTVTTVLTWPVIDSTDALASIASDNDNDGIPDVRDSYPLLNRLPISVAGGVSGYPDRSSAGAGSWHHIRPVLPLHNQFVGSYATRAGLSFHTGFNGDARILARLPVATSEGQTIAAPEGQSVLAAAYQPGVPIQMNYADFAASMSRDEFGAMAEQSRQDIAVVYNFRLHGVEPSVAEDASLAGGRAGVVIPLPESLHDHTSIQPLHYTGGAWSGFSSESDEPATAGFAPLQAGACPDDSGVAGSLYRTGNGALNTRKRPGDACMVLYLTDGAAADRDGNINGIVEALIGLAATAPR